MPKRVVVLGTTGLEKRQTIQRLIEYKQNRDADYRAKVVDFEGDYICPSTPSGNLQDYLDARAGDQHRNWRIGMGKCMDQLESCEDDCFLLLHGSIIRDEYGTRCPVSLAPLAEWRPDLVVTLIDDVQLCWHRTQKRASDQPFRGMPTLEQLIANRRAEIFLGDILAAFVSDRMEQEGIDSCTPHYVVAVRHPCSVLDRLVHPARDQRTVYLSFPISAPRRMLARQNEAGLHEVNAFLQRAYAFAQTHPSIVLFCPLTIDELPLRKLAASGEQDEVVFSRQMRWDVSAFISEPLLAADPYPDEIVLPRSAVEAAAAGMEYDVRTRDYRLIDQSTAIAAFCPAFREDPQNAPDREGTLSRGMRNEIEYGAVRTFLPVYVFQDPARDPEGVAKWRWGPDPGSMGPSPSSARIKFCESVDAVFDNLL